MGRPSGPKDYCDGKWTKAVMTSFIKNLLRSGTRKWSPNSTVLKKARVSRGFYLCSCCGESTPVTKVDSVSRKRVKNVVVDHIEPVIPPEVGFTTWDSFIDRLFVEVEKLQVLCLDCHKIKTSEETAIAAQRRREEKDIVKI